MGIDNAFRDSFHLFKDNIIFIIPHFLEYIIDFGMFIGFGVFAVLLVGLSLFRLIISSNYNPEALASHLGASGFFIVSLLIMSVLFMILITIFLSAFARTAIIGMTKEGLESKKTSLRTGWESIKRDGFTVFGFILFLGILLIPIVFLGFFPAILMSLLNAGGFLRAASLFLSFFITLLLIAVVYTLLMFTPQCIVLESKGIFSGVKRSYDFVRNNIFLVLEYLIIVVFVSFFVFVVTFVLFFPLNYVSKGNAVIRLGVDFFENFFSLLIGLILAPYFEMVKTHMVKEWQSAVTVV